MKGNTVFDRGAIYFHYPHYGGKGDSPAGAIRKGDYKLIWFYEDDHIELYNLKMDISEKRKFRRKLKRRELCLYRKNCRNGCAQCAAKMPVYNRGL